MFWNTKPDMKQKVLCKPDFNANVIYPTHSDSRTYTLKKIIKKYWKLSCYSAKVEQSKFTSVKRQTLREGL